MSDEEWEKFADDWLEKYPEVNHSPLKKWSGDLIESVMATALERADKEIEKQILLRDICLIRIPEWRIREITGDVR